MKYREKVKVIRADNDLHNVFQNQLSGNVEMQCLVHIGGFFFVFFLIFTDFEKERSTDRIRVQRLFLLF